MLCSGNAINLSSSGANTYTWVPGNLTGPNINVSPNTSTNYTVTGMNSAGCTSSAAVNVSVNPTPTVSINSTTTNLYSGQSVTLTGIGASAYTWQPINTTGSIVILSPTATAAYSLTGNTNGCNSTPM